MTTEEFIQKSRTVHGDKYDYSKVVNPKYGERVCIICPKHGEFWPTHYNHLYGQKCRQCANEEKGQKQIKSKEHYIASAIKVHGDKYDYSLVENVKGKEDSKIICPIHGIFEQSMSQHILGRGCPKCGTNKGKKPLYGIGINDLEFGEYQTKCYELWAGMLFRCYSRRFSSYKNVTVCDEWLTLSNFKKWFENPENGYREGYHLDKDILVKGNKVYSPETCCFVPTAINSLLVFCCQSKRGKVIGVGREGKNGYRASITKYGKSIRIGCYSTIEEAFAAYKETKEAYIKEVAQEYYNRGLIAKKVYDALMRYKVEITD